MASSLNTLNEIDKTVFASQFECEITDLSRYVTVTDSDLTVVSQNIRSIYCNLDDLVLNISLLKFKPDVIVLTECRLNPNKPIPSLNNYTYFTSTNHINQNDGVVTYIKESLTPKVKEILLDHASCLQVKIDKVVILGLYRSPSNTNAEIFINSLNSHLDTIKNYKNIILTGDININLIPRPHEKTQDVNNRNNYVNMLATHSLFTGHTTPTRESSCLDHFFLKITRNQKADIAVLNTTITDHMMTLLKLSKNKTNFNSYKKKKQ